MPKISNPFELLQLEVIGAYLLHTIELSVLLRSLLMWQSSND